MNIGTLKDQLTSLQEELVCLNAAEQHTREQIEQVLKAISVELDNAQLNEERDANSHLSALSTSLRRFEIEHPELTDSINRILLSLSNMGI